LAVSLMKKLKELEIKHTDLLTYEKDWIYNSFTVNNISLFENWEIDYIYYLSYKSIEQNTVYNMNKILPYIEQANKIIAQWREEWEREWKEGRRNYLNNEIGRM
jgi:hypothetical protein